MSEQVNLPPVWCLQAASSTFVCVSGAAADILQPGPLRFHT